MLGRVEQPHKACLSRGLQLKTLDNTENSCLGHLKSKQQQANGEQGWSQSITNPLYPGWVLWALFSLLCLSALTQGLMELWNYEAGVGSRIYRWNPLFPTRGLGKVSFARKYRRIHVLFVSFFFSLFSLLTLPQGQPHLRICIAFVVGVWAPKTQ